MIKALDIKVEGLTSTQLHLIIEGIQSMLSYPDETSFIANNPKTEYTLLSNRVSANNPLYKDDKSDTLYVLIGERSKKAFAIMSKGRLINTSIHTNKKLFAAIVENSDEDLQWLVIKNPEYKQMRAARYAARKDSEVYEREKDKAYNNSLIKQHLKTLETKLKDSEFEHDNFLLIARRAAVEWKKGNKDFFNKIDDEYGDVSYDASQAFNYLKNIYVEKLGKEYSDVTIEDHKRNTRNFAGYPWQSNYKLYRESNTLKDKSGYKLNIEKYIWKRAEAFAKSKDDAVIKKLEEQYNDLIQNILPAAVSRLISTENWEALKQNIDKVKNLKEQLTTINELANDQSQYRDSKWREITKQLPYIITLLRTLKEEFNKESQGVES